MTDYQSQSSRRNHSHPQQPPTLPPLPFAAGYGGDPRRDGPATPSTGRRSAGGYETGESSSSAARRRTNDAYMYTGDVLGLLDHDGDHDAILASGLAGDYLQTREEAAAAGGGEGRDEEEEEQGEDHHESDDDGGRDQRDQQRQKHQEASRDGRAQRSRHRNKMGAGFLLRNPLSAGRSLGLRRFKDRHSPAAADHARPNGGFDASPRTSSGSSDQARRRSSGPSHATPGGLSPLSNDIEAGRRFSDSHPHQERPAMDADSSQIVLMALNLSESRRMATRLNPARPAPPRLTPLPDVSQASNLRQHLQQQRKTSRGSRALLEATPDGPPALIMDGSSSLQFALDPGLDLPYNYHFSPSTLARVQKAKEHLELLAQYRRLLDFLPPLKPGAERPTSSSPAGSPVVGQSRRSSFGAHHAPPVMLGRQYNPLQYVRNRKVRARERQTIDGERQGFGDVECVKSWVSTVSSQMSLAGTSLLQGKTSIPAFPGAEDVYNQDSAVSLARIPSASRGRRPRADWFVEPCDMIADAYWLEKDRHKNLVEDRHWRKIFPLPRADALRVLSGGEEDSVIRRSLSVEQHEDDAVDEGESDTPKIRADVPHNHNSAKERAKQKLQHIREGFHHRHAASGHAHDLHRHQGGSTSDFSDSEDNEPGHEGKKKPRAVRKGTISSDSNDLLEKQMLEMLAKEAMENELERVPESPESRPVAPADKKRASRPPLIRLGSRRGSVADQSDSDPKSAPGKLQLGSLLRRSQHADDPSTTTSVAGNQSPSASSPEARPSRPVVMEPASHADQTPPCSRSASPVRKPLDKIKKILRDKSSELFEPQPEHAEGGEGDSRIPNGLKGSTKPGKRQSSPSGKLLSPTFEGGSKLQRSHSKRARVDEAVGLRGMFKGPRLDTVIRDSVYRLGDKIGDRIWKRDATTEGGDLDVTDDSDNDRAKQAMPPRSPGKKDVKKHYFISTPQFHHDAPNGHRMAAAGDGLDLFKASQIDGRSGMVAPYAAETAKTSFGGSDASEAGSSPRALPRARGAAPTMAGLRQNGRAFHHHWPPVDRSVAPRQVTFSRREVARMRTLILSSGIKAREVHRRAVELHKPFSAANLTAANPASAKQQPGGLPWSAILEVGPKRPELLERRVSTQQAYPLAAHTLNVAIQTWGTQWSLSAGRFADQTSLELGRRAWDIRNLLKDELSEMTRRAADEADETSRDLALGQPLRMKHVVDTIEKIQRKRGRRFRWLRRGMWLTVEWLLVGFMWYVWFMVTILRILLGVGRGFLGCVRWLLWL